MVNMMSLNEKQKKEKDQRPEIEDEEVEDYLFELIEAKMEQAELRLKSSKYWIFRERSDEEEYIVGIH